MTLRLHKWHLKLEINLPQNTARAECLGLEFETEGFSGDVLRATAAIVDLVKNKDFLNWSRTLAPYVAVGALSGIIIKQLWNYVNPTEIHEGSIAIEILVKEEDVNKLRRLVNTGEMQRRMNLVLQNLYLPQVFRGSQITSLELLERQFSGEKTWIIAMQDADKDMPHFMQIRRNPEKSHRAVDISFTRPLSVKKLDHYRISAVSALGGKSQLTNGKGDVSNIAVENLRSDEEYHFEIITMFLDGTFSKPMTTGKIKIDKLSDILFEIIGEDRVLFSWQTEKEAECYQFSLSTCEENILQEETSSSKVEIELSSQSALRIGCTYHVTVACKIPGSEHPIIIAEANCLIGGFMVARNVEAKASSKNPIRCIDVKFDPPKNAIPSSYLVVATPDKGKTVREVQTSETELTIKYLKSDTTYQISVLALYHDYPSPHFRSQSNTVKTGSYLQQGTGSMISVQDANLVTVNVQGSTLHYQPTVYTDRLTTNHATMGKVINLEVEKSKDGHKVTWNTPAFSHHDYRIEHFLVKICTSNGEHTNSHKIPFKEDERNFHSRFFPLSGPDTYQVTVKTHYEDIDGEQMYYSELQKVSIDISGMEQSSLARAMSLMNVQKGTYGKRELVMENRFVKTYKGTMASEATTFIGMMEIELRNLRDEDIEDLKERVGSVMAINKHHLLLNFHSMEAHGLTLTVITEFCSWPSLEMILEENPFGITEMEIREYSRQILQALDFLHNNNIIHGEIRCRYIFASPRRAVKLGGFSLEKKVERSMCSSALSALSTTNFTPPEEERVKSDIWGLGCAIIEMRTGQLPWGKLRGLEVLEALNNHLTPLHGIDKNFYKLSPDLKAILEKKIFVPENDRSDAATLLTDNWFCSADDSGGLLGSQRDAESDSAYSSASSGSLRSYSGLGDNETNPEERITRREIPSYEGSVYQRDWKWGKNLGSGYYGEVFLLIHGSTRRKRAVKKLRIKQVNFQQKWEQDEKLVMRELEMSLKFDHSNVVKCYDCLRKTESELYLVMEYMEGGSLRDKLDNDRAGFDESLTKTYTKQILIGLNYLHCSHFVHRDIKGANILQDRNGTVKLGDLGFAKSLTDGKSVKDSRSSPVGTFLWMSPEVVRKECCGKSADIWSLGCTVVEMLTTSPPYGFMKSEAEMYARLSTHENVADVSLRRIPHYSKECKSFLESIFVERMKRPSSADLSSHDWLK